MLSPLRYVGSRVLPNVSLALTQLREISVRTRESHHETELVPGNFDSIDTIRLAISQFNKKSYSDSINPQMNGYKPNSPLTGIKYCFASLNNSLDLNALKVTIKLNEKDGVVQAELIDHNRKPA